MGCSMSEEETAAVVQRYLDELEGDSPAEPLVQARSSAKPRALGDPAGDERESTRLVMDLDVAIVKADIA
jgi:hypothetical protein